MVGLAFDVGGTDGGVVVVAVPPIVIGLPLTVPVCCWLTATAATAPMATKPLAIAPTMSNLTREVSAYRALADGPHSCCQSQRSCHMAALSCQLSPNGHATLPGRCPLIVVMPGCRSISRRIL